MSHLAVTRTLFLASPGCSWQLLAAPRSALGAHGRSWRKFMKAYRFTTQNLYFLFPRATLNVSHELYSGSLKIYENHCFVDFWIQGQKIIKSSLLRLVLSTSGANARKSSHRASWEWFSRRLEPRPDSHQIQPPRTGFGDFLSQGWKVIESSLLGIVLSTSGAKATKSSNRFSWD